MPCGGHLWNIKKQLYSRCVRLFQRQSAKFDPSNPVKWYDSVHLGHNSMWELMPSISIKLVYRSATQTINHALRQCIFWIVLVISPIDIEWVSRHKSETSLKTYTGYNTASSIKRSMSDTHSENLRCDAAGLTWGTTSQFKMYIWLKRSSFTGLPSSHRSSTESKTKTEKGIWH